MTHAWVTGARLLAAFGLLSLVALGAACGDDAEPAHPSLALEWVASGELRIFSSPRAADLNGDGVLDLVLGHGQETLPQAGYVTARDGRSGTELWRVQARDEIFGSPGLADLTGDGTPDVVIGGRNAELYAIDGRSGEVLWRFYPRGHADLDGWYNFYTPQFLDDLDGDAVPEVLIANGGDPGLPPFYPRPPGHLLVLSGRSGAIIAAGETPDTGETYMSALVYRRASDGTELVVFGTGGETLPGSLWVVPLADVIAGDLSRSREVIAPANRRGLVAPPALVDLTHDGTLDIVAATFDGRLVALDGESLEPLWLHQFPDSETWATPAVGFLDGDAVPDLFAAFSVGTLPAYTASILVAVSGATGTLLWQEQFDLPLLSSPLAVDVVGDRRDEVLITLSPLAEDATQRLLLIDPDGWRVTALLTRAGVSFGTGLVIDLDGDGALELVHSRFGEVGWTLERRALGPLGSERVSWGAYLGTASDGRFGTTSR